MSLKDLCNTIGGLLNGSLIAFDGSNVDEPIAGRLRAAQLSTIARHTPWVMIANVFNVSVLLVASHNSSQHKWAILWTFCVVTFASFIYLKDRSRRDMPVPLSISTRAVRIALRNSCLLGVLWAIVPLLLLQGADQSNKIVVITVIIGMLCGGALSLASLPVVGLAFMLPLLAASIVSLVRLNDPIFWLIIGLTISYFAVLLRAMIIYAKVFANRYISDITNEEAARTDRLTGLPNRRAFEDHFDDLSQLAAKYDEAFAVFFLDLDKFKDINDNFGHEGGDIFLTEIAECLRLAIREGDFATRISGDEFAVIAQNIGDPAEALIIAERLQRVFQSPFQMHDMSITGSATIGIAMVPSDGFGREEILRKADEALYNAKQKRRGSFQFFNPNNEGSALLQKELFRDLQSAIANGELALVFQPVVNLKTHAVNGFEALLRWDHPVRGNIPLSDFVPLAEKSGLIHEIGEWVINRALTEAVTWPEHIRVAINISPVQFRTVEIVSIVESALETSGLAPGRLELEVTESVVLADIDRAENVLTRLREMGVTIALDDFGTGYSSLTYLVRLPFDRMKIDRSFVQAAPESPQCCKLIRGIVGLAREFDLGLIAEGAETASHLNFIEGQGIDEVQGYVVSRPLISEHIDEFLNSFNPPEAVAA